MDPKHRAELIYCAWEAALVKAMIDTICRDPRHEIRRPLVIVGNLSYGAIALAAIREKLIEEGHIVWIKRQQSSRAHRNIDYVDANLFSDEEIHLLVDRQPNVIVVDGSYSLDRIKLATMGRDPEAAKYPDSRLCYANYFGVLSSVLTGRGATEVAADLGLIAPLGTVGGGCTGRYEAEHRALRVRLTEMIRGRVSTDFNAYRMVYWYPGRRSLGISENRVLRPLPAALRLQQYDGLSAYAGPTVIFVQSCVEPDAVPPPVQAMADRIPHSPGYFDMKPPIFPHTGPANAPGSIMGTVYERYTIDTYRRIISMKWDFLASISADNP